MKISNKNDSYLRLFAADRTTHSSIPANAAIACATMECRPGCGACCIAPSSPHRFPACPRASRRGRCVQLDAQMQCRLFGQLSGLPSAFRSRPKPTMCGSPSPTGAEHPHALGAPDLTGLNMTPPDVHAPHPALPRLHELAANGRRASGAAARCEAQLVQAPAGAVLFEEGAPCRGFPMVLQGGVRVARGSPGGRTLELYRVTPGELCVVSTSCLFGQVPLTAHGQTWRSHGTRAAQPAGFARWVPA
jgi:hypothetical protein